MNYAGDITSMQAHSLLAEEGDRSAVLIDVRTSAERLFVGVPVVDNDSYYACPLYEYPEMERSGSFVADLQGFDLMQYLLFICRSGGRSREAAIIATSAGFRNSYNVVDGFEGHLDSSGHRGKTSGWKASNLPWRQF